MSKANTIQLCSVRRCEQESTVCVASISVTVSKEVKCVAPGAFIHTYMYIYTHTSVAFILKTGMIICKQNTEGKYFVPVCFVLHTLID